MNELKLFTKEIAPGKEKIVKYYSGKSKIFESHGIEKQLKSLFGKSVSLANGSGYLIIEHTEALHVIDVNSGNKSAEESDQESTALKTNLEAVKEIAYQVRLRNIGGIIIIDFIDMRKTAHKDKVMAQMHEAMKKDKSQTNVLPLTELGLVQMTRKRTRESLEHVLCEPCVVCSGRGTLKSAETICYEIFRKISRNSARSAGNSVTIRVHPRIADMLLKEEEPTMNQLERDTSKRLIIAPAKELNIEKYEIIWQR